MAVELFSNLPSTTVTSGGTSAPASGTPETWTVASSSGFPAASSSGTPPGQFHVADINNNSEIILVTNVSGTTWTVTRGAEGSTPVAHSAGFAVFQVTTAGALTQLRSLDWINVVTQYGADPTGVTDATSAIQNALAAAGSNAQVGGDNPMGGGVVYVPWGKYLISGPLNIPPHVYMVGEVAITLPIAAFDVQYSGSRLVAAASWAPSSATGVIQFLSKTPGGWAKNMEQAGVRGLVIDCSANSSTNLNGILNTGPVYDIHLEDVFINAAGHNGIHATSQSESGIGPALPYHHYYQRVTCYNAVNTGFNVSNFTDSSFLECMAFSCANGWVLAGMQDSIFSMCRSQWNTAIGFSLGNTGGHLVFSACETDNNGQNGWKINSASGTGGSITLTGCISECDGRASSASALWITGCTTPVTVTGFTQGMDSVSGTGAPTVGLQVGTSGQVLIGDSYFEGSTTAFQDDGSNTNLILDNVIAGTGTIGSLAYVTYQAQPSVPGPAANGFAAWTCDPYVSPQSASAGTAKTLYLNAVYIAQPATTSKVWFNISSTGSGGTAGNNWAGLFKSDGTLVASVGIDSAVTGSGLQSFSWTSSYLMMPGMYWIGIVFNATGMPQLYRAGGNNPVMMNANLSAATYRTCSNGTNVTTLANITPSSNSTSAVQAYWLALS